MLSLKPSKALRRWQPAPHSKAQDGERPRAWARAPGRNREVALRLRLRDLQQARHKDNKGGDRCRRKDHLGKRRESEVSITFGKEHGGVSKEMLNA